MATHKPLLEFLEARTLLAAVLVKAIHASTQLTIPPSNVTDVNGTLYFTVNNRMYRSDGSPGGAATLVSPSIWSPTQLTNLGGKLYFNDNGSQLWSTDGTEAGTGPVVPDGCNPRNVTLVGNRLFFRGTDGSGGDELWTSDGTAAGTTRVKDINPGGAGSDPRGFTAVGNRVFFRADDGSAGQELWTSDGTAAGTVMVKDVNTGAAGSEPRSLTNVNGTLYFSATDGSSGYELWRSDGTAAGTTRVIDLRAGAGGSTPLELQNVGGTLMFLANDGVSGFEVYKSDGTAAGTRLVKELVPGAAGGMADNLTAVGSTLYFTANVNDGTGWELWKTDGTAGGTAMVKDIAPGAASSQPAQMRAWGNKLLFIADDATHGFEPWISDGTAAGTAIVRDINPGGSRSDTHAWTPAADGQRMFFIADDGNVGAVWATDGTTGGTTLIKRSTVFQPTGSSVRNTTTVGTWTYFSADDGVHGQELWKTDGTTAGTTMVADLNPGAGGTDLQRFVNFNGALYFLANSHLWKSDGTAAGTVQVSDGSISTKAAPVQIAGTLFFVASGTGGSGIWKSDGTTAGTTLVKSVSAPEQLTASGGKLFFVATEPTHGYELWASDGTAAGTAMVKDVLAGANSSGPMLLTDAGGTLFFRADDGSGSGYELWKSDGTAAGTAMVKDVRAGAGSSNIWTMAAAGGTLFFNADDGVHGNELWKSDGTAAGTVIVKDIAAGGKGASPGGLAAVGSLLYFRADDQVSGSELWKTDGTSGGTVMVKDINAGAGGSYVRNILPVPGGRAVFAVGSDSHEYITDGTAAGTFAIHDSLTDDAAVLGTQLIFHSWGVEGDELRKIDLASVSPTSPAAATTAKITTSIAATGAVASAGTASASATSYTFYDALVRYDQPANIAVPTGGGLAPIRVVYGMGNGDESLPDESYVRSIARQADDAGQPVALDLESWPTDNRYYSEGAVSIGLERLGAVLDWMHNERPSVKAGVISLAPLGVWPVPAAGTPAYASWHAADDRVKPVVDKMDLMMVGVYTLDSSESNWLSYSRGLLTEAQRVAPTLPLLPFAWVRYDGTFDQTVSQRQMPAEMWRTEMDVMSQFSGGAILWDGYGEWGDDDAPWYTLTRDFAHSPAPLPPRAATGLTASGNQSASRVDLAWTDAAYNESGYRIERRPAAVGGTFSTVAALAADSTSFADTTATPGVDYVYRVVAANAAGDSLPGNEAAARIPAPPDAPGNVSASQVAPGRVRVGWSESSSDVQQFRIERAPGGGGAFAEIGTAIGTARNFDDVSAATGVTYRYRVRAENALGLSPYSAEASITTTAGGIGQVARWKLDDGSDTAAADSAGAHAGSLVGGPAWAAGTLGGALTFDGADDHVVVADAADLRFTAAQDFALSAWVNLATLPGRASWVAAKSRGSGAWYGVGLDATNHWTFGGATSSVSGAVAATGWTHVAVVQDSASGQRRLYVNGALVATGVAQAADGTGALWIGGAESVNEFLPGIIDDVRVYARALTDSDVQALANPRVSLQGTAGDDVWTIRISSDGSAYEFFTGAGASSPAFTRPRDAVASIEVAGGAGDDQLTLDFTGGDPRPDYGLSFDGGSSGNDRVIVRGASAGDPFNVDPSHVLRGSSTMLTYTNAETIELDAGAFTFAADAGAKTVRVDAGASAVFATTQHLAGLDLAGGLATLVAGHDKVLVLAAVSVTGGGKLDLKDNGLILNYAAGAASPLGAWTGSSYSGVSGLLAQGRDGGAWDGAGILSSSAGGSSDYHTLGAAEASDALGLAGSQTGAWMGETVDASAVLVKYTYGGDANLDGQINIDDYTRIDSNMSVDGALKGYFNADFNLDGNIDIDDYTVIDSNIGIQSAPL